MKDYWDNKNIATICSIFPIASFLIFGLILTLGTFHLGHIPNYGQDPDPTNLKIDWLNYFLFIPIFLGLFGTPTWIMLTISLVVNKVKFSKKEIGLYLVSLASLLLLFLFKFQWPNQFMWVFD